ncbi:MAG: LuxR C-terminal-related transcriptional regulator [Rectinemataceae bacterium]
MKLPSFSSEKIYRRIGLLFTALFVVAIIVDTAELMLMRGFSVLDVLSHTTILSLILLCVLFLLSAFVPVLKWIQPIALLVSASIPFSQSSSTMYGLGPFIAGVLLLFRMGFFATKRTLKAAILLLYLYLCEAIPLIGRSDALVFDSIMPLLFTTVFLIFLFIMYSEKIIVYMREPKPALSLSGAGLSHTEALYLKGLLKGANSKQVAADAKVKDSTVRNTMARVYKKFGVPDRTALMAKLEKFDIVD